MIVTDVSFTWDPHKHARVTLQGHFRYLTSSRFILVSLMRNRDWRSEDFCGSRPGNTKGLMSMSSARSLGHLRRSSSSSASDWKLDQTSTQTARSLFVVTSLDRVTDCRHPLSRCPCFSAQYRRAGRHVLLFSNTMDQLGRTPSLFDEKSRLLEDQIRNPSNAYENFCVKIKYKSKD